MPPRLLILFVFASTGLSIKAQQPPLTGEYYLRGVMETASGFKLNADSTFEFFFSQGALDRFGKGIWAVKNNELVMNSPDRPARAFALITSRKQAGDSITILLKDPNAAALRYVHAFLLSKGRNQEGTANDEGLITLPAVRQIDTLALVFEFCPEKVAVFADLSAQHNYFEFRIEPTMMELYLENFRLRIVGDGLTGSHPLMQGEAFRYEKASVTSKQNQEE